MSNVRTRLRTAGAVVGVAVLASIGIAGPASAHDAPKPGTTCDMSGTAEVVHGTVYVCRNLKDGQQPRWDAGKKVTTTALTLSDGWAKAAKKGDMSAAFGTLKNPTSKPIRVIAAISPASTVMQLHEVVDKDGEMVMQQKNGGFVIPAGGSFTLKPSGNHIMYMDLTKALSAGKTTALTLITDEGGLVTFKPLIKVFSGGNESYEDTSGMPGMH